MCGIAGIAAWGAAEPPSEGTVRAQCAVLRHRGPDGEGVVVEAGVGLGMTRLAVIDVEGGEQPVFNEDRTVRVVYNGEIYNYRELRRELEAKGHRFRSASDTEVIVHLYEEDGHGFPARLSGMFALALHDTKRKRLLLARDAIGVKPLYYGFAGGRILFASEVKGILAAGIVRPTLDVGALAEFLAWEYVPAPRTLMKEIRKLEPGCSLDIDLDSGERTERRWWSIPPAGERAARTEAEWEEAVDGKLAECVRRQLVSDVPLGALLSGGVDSSLVVAGMDGARTFSIGFEDETYDERKYAEAVAVHLGASHRSEVLRPDLAGLFDRLMPHLDDPIGDFSVFPTYLVSRLAREEVTVALSGDGGDELFGGYETYVAEEKARTWKRLPRFVRRGIIEPAIGSLRPGPRKKGWRNKAIRFVEGLAHDEALGHARWRLFVGEALGRSLFSDEARRAIDTPPEAHILRLAAEAGGRDAVDRALYIDTRSYLTDNCLVKVDRMSMACSLETRVPFLDTELVELAFSMPSSLKVRGGETKRLLRRVARRHVPAWCVDRPKEGFSIPIKHMLRSELKPLMTDLLSEGRIEREGVFQVSAVRRLVEEHLKGEANHSHALWSLMVFHDWRTRWSV
ncbi:MAG: asparagine synthase (glutamine-hydrolyzing) [Candidatus Eisenbacteria bacterium]